MDSLPQLLLSREDVFIHTSSTYDNGDSRVRGRLIIERRVEGTFLEWKPTEDGDGTNGGAAGKDSGWTMVSNTVSYKNDRASPTADSVTVNKPPVPHKHVVNFDIKDLKSFRKSKHNPIAHPYFVFILKCGTTYPPLYFHRGGTKQFITELRKHLTVTISPQDSCLYLVREHDPQALSKSFDELHLFERDQATDIVSNFVRDPYGSALSGFSRVTHFLRDTLVAVDSHMAAALATQDPSGLTTSLETGSGLGADNTQIVDLSLALKTTLGESGFEMVTAKVDLPPRPKVTRGKPLNAQQWMAFMDSEGRVMKVAEVKEIIFRGGIEASLRTEVWKFLLGYYPWNSTSKERVDQRKQKVDDYFRMKLQWKSISSDQESRFSDLRDRKSLIEKDVTRTDRTHKFFEGENNPNISVLYDILLTHCMYHFDLGYVQGMSDLLAPILVIMENEVDAFWCFAGFIKMVGLNFEKDQTAMKNQLLQLQYLINFVDPELANYLESHDSINMYFCFRWLLIIFKREFTFPDIMRLWEVIWTGLPCQNFHLLLCLAILDSAKTTLIENSFGFTEILKHINDLSNTIDVEAMMSQAEAICLQLCACRDLPAVVHNILGLSTAPGDRPPFNPVHPSDVEQDAPSQHSQNSPDRSTAARGENSAAHPKEHGENAERTAGGERTEKSGQSAGESSKSAGQSSTSASQSSTSADQRSNVSGSVGQNSASVCQTANISGSVGHSGISKENSSTPKGKNSSPEGNSSTPSPASVRARNSPASDDSSIEILSEMSEQFP